MLLAKKNSACFYHTFLSFYLIDSPDRCESLLYIEFFKRLSFYEDFTNPAERQKIYKSKKRLLDVYFIIRLKIDLIIGRIFHAGRDISFS
jgi:hypothetical protein